MRVNVLLAEDAGIVRRAIRNLLTEREDIKVVGEAATFPEVLQKATVLRFSFSLRSLAVIRAMGVLPHRHFWRFLERFFSCSCWASQRCSSSATAE